MSSISVRLQPFSRSTDIPWAYRVAGRRLELDQPLPALASFEVEPPGEGLAPVSLDEAELSENAEVFSEEVLLGGRARRIDGRLGSRAYHLSVDSAVFLIARDGSAVVRLAEEEDDPALLADALLGPALSLALALQGVFCLHAAAVEVEGRIVAFVGDSGAGKSTLAALLSGGAWRLAADDILPVERSAGEYLALPRFPQLKIAPAEQPSPSLPESLPLAAVYRLDARERGERVEIQPIGWPAATLLLVRQTVASRLFDRSLLQRQFDACALLARDFPVRSLAYPHDPAAAPRIRRVIADDLGLPEETR